MPRSLCSALIACAKNARISLPMSQRQLGSACGVDKATVYRHEAGHRAVTVERLCAYLSACGVDTVSGLVEVEEL